MPTLINGIPLFTCFASIRMGLPGANAELHIKSGEKHLGGLSSISDIDALVPSKNMRIEIERNDGEEEVRIVNALDGGYYSARQDIAIKLTQELDARTDHLMGPPDRSLRVFEERYQPIWFCFIQYDHEAQRILPTLHRFGKITSLDDWRVYSRKPTSATILDDDYCVVTDRRTGNCWVAERAQLQETKEELRRIKCGAPIVEGH